jgi:hypothetical protein
VWSRGVGSVHFLKAVVRLQSNNSFQKVLVLLMMGIMMPETC